MARITFVAPSAPAENKPEKSLPIGTGGPAFPRVPASSGPPVPPAAPPAAAPTRIPFQMPPSAVPPKVAAQTPAPAPPTTSAPVQETPKVVPVAATSVEPTQEPMVVLPLCPILASLPPMQIAGDVTSVPADAKISFRIALIAPQLATGKVTIPPKDFHTALTGSNIAVCFSPMRWKPRCSFRCPMYWPTCPETLFACERTRKSPLRMKLSRHRFRRRQKKTRNVLPKVGKQRSQAPRHRQSRQCRRLRLPK